MSAKIQSDYEKQMDTIKALEQEPPPPPSANPRMHLWSGNNIYILQKYVLQFQSDEHLNVQINTSEEQTTKIQIEKKLDNDKWINRKKECRQRIAKNFTLEKMVTRYGEVWSIDH